MVSVSWEEYACAVLDNASLLLLGERCRRQTRHALLIGPIWGARSWPDEPTYVWTWEGLCTAVSTGRGDHLL